MSGLGVEGGQKKVSANFSILQVISMPQVSLETNA